MTKSERVDKLYEAIMCSSDEQLIDVWNAYHRRITCAPEKVFWLNTQENREMLFDAENKDDVLTAIFHNNYGFNLDCEYFRFFSEPLIEGYSAKQARRLITSDDGNAIMQIALDLVEDGETLDIEFIEKILNDYDKEKLRYDVIKTIVNSAPIDDIVNSFNDFLTETRGCEEQIFEMESGLEEIWFGMMGMDGYFMEQMTTLYEAIKSGTFRITDRFWEMTTEDGNSFNGIRSFNELYDSTNYARLEDEYADYIIATKGKRGYEFPKETVHELADLFHNYGI